MKRVALDPLDVAADDDGFGALRLGPLLRLGYKGASQAYPTDFSGNDESHNFNSESRFDNTNGMRLQPTENGSRCFRDNE